MQTAGGVELHFHGFFSMLRHSLKPWEVVVFTVYFDDSGTHLASDTAVAACLIASDDHWKRLSEAWAEIGDAEGFEFFHMADFINQQAPPYCTWDEQKRERVYQKLTRAIGNCVVCGYSVTVSKAAFDVHVAPELKSQIGFRHYTFAVRACIGNMREWRLKHGGDFQVVFDWMQEGRGEVIDIRRTLDDPGLIERGLPLTSEGWSFQPKEHFPPLQAADIFAWNVYNATVNSVVAGAAKPSRWLYMLRQNVTAPLSIGLFDEGKIKSFNQQWEAM